MITQTEFHGMCLCAMRASASKIDFNIFISWQTSQVSIYKASKSLMRVKGVDTEELKDVWTS